MSSKPDDIVRLALDYYASPGSYPELSDPASPLPEHTGHLLEVAAASDKAAQISGSDITAKSPEGDLVAATVYFIEHVLMAPGGSNYRVLGLNPGASEAQVRKHYQLLNHILLLDQHDKTPMWKTESALRLNHAYGVLRSSSHHRQSHINLKPVTIPDGSGRAKPSAIKPSAIGTGEATRDGRPPIKRVASAGGAAPILQDKKQTQGDDGNVYVHVKSTAALDSAEQEMQRQGSSQKHQSTNNSFVAANIERAYGDRGARVGGVASGQPDAVRVNEADKSKLFEQYLRDDDLPRQPVAYVEYSPGSALPGARGRRPFPLVQVTVSLLVLIGMGLVIYALQIEPTGLATRSVNEEINRTEPVAELDQPQFAEHGANQLDVVARQEAPMVSSAAREKSGSAATSAPVQVSVRENIVQESSKQNEQALAGVYSATAESAARQLAESAQAIATAVATAPMSVLRTQMSSPVTATHQPKAESSLQRPNLSGSEAIAALAPKVDEPRKQIEIHTEAPAVIPVTPEPVPVLTEVELNGLLAKFVMAYNVGDIDMFGNLFAEHARSDDKTSRAGIRQDYLELFSRTNRRQFSFKNVRWKVDGLRAYAEGEFSVDVRQMNSATSRTSTGRITLQAEKNPQGLQITELRYVLDHDVADNISISEAELRDLLGKFVSAYESGDLNRFTGLFIETARSDDQISRAGIRDDYEALFSQTSRRIFAFNDMKWRIEGMRAIGEGSFNVSVQSQNATKPRISTGRISLRAEKGPAGLLITEIKHRTN